jgi:hypothetical protein
MTTIHTGNTTTTGFTISSDNSGDLVLKTGGAGGTTAATFSGSNQQATFNNAISQPGAFMFRNRIINGNMAIDQRNGGAAQTITAAAALAYTADRWYAYCTGANVTGQQVAGSGDTQYRYQFTGAASVTKIGFAQRIESFNSYDLNNSVATLSVDLSNSLLTTVTWTAWYANTADTFGTLASPTRTQIDTGTFTVSSTLTRYSTQITIPSAATTGIEIEFSVGAQTSGTWNIGNVQLEKGSVATTFEQRPIGLELALCQRYYQSYTPNFNAYSIYGNTTTKVGYYTSFSVRMRVTPTVGGTASLLTTNVTSGSIEFGTSAEAYGVRWFNSGTNWARVYAGLLTFDAEL